MASPQTKYQRRIRAEGRWALCGRPATVYAGICAYHAAKNRDKCRHRYRKKKGIPLDAPVAPRRPRREGA
jgi:hypothetical protein